MASYRTEFIIEEHDGRFDVTRKGRAFARGLDSLDDALRRIRRARTPGRSTVGPGVEVAHRDSDGRLEIVRT